MNQLNVLLISLTLYIIGSCFFNQINCQNLTLKSSLKNKVTSNIIQSRRDNKKLRNGPILLLNRSNIRAKKDNSSLRIRRPGRPMNLKRLGDITHERIGYVDFEDSLGQKKYNYIKDNRDRKQQSTGFEHYYTHPSGENGGKIFNQDDIDDVYLNGNHEYKKLVKDYNKKLTFHPESGTTYTGGDVSSIKGGNIFGSSEKGQQNVHSISNVNNFGKNTQHEDYDYKTLPNYDKKTFEFSKSNDFESLRNSYGDLIGDGGGWKPGDSVFKHDGLYGEKFGFKPMIPDSEKYYNLDTEDTFQTTTNPFQSYDSSYPLKNYASKYNFDSKPFPDIEPGKYSSSHNFDKNNGFVSEFDLKGNPIGASSIFAESLTNKGVFNSNKETHVDLTKAFYNLNKSPASNYGSSYNFDGSRPSESSSASNTNFAYNKGYASTYAYQPPYGTQGSSSDESTLKNYDFNKYNNHPSYHKGSQYPGSRPTMEIPHTIIIPVPHPYPVKVPIAKPVAVPILKEIKVPIEKVVPYPVIKNVPYPIEKRIPVPVEKQVPVPVPHPYPVKIPIIKNVYHHSRDHDADGKFSSQFRDKEPQPKDFERGNWDYEPEPQHSHRETWKDDNYNKNVYNEDWEDDINYKESPHNEHWEHEQSHKQADRDNWEQNNPKTPSRENWEQHERHKIPHREKWEDDSHTNSHRESWDDEPRHKYRQNDSWKDKSRHRPSHQYSWDEEPKRSPSIPHHWEKPPTSKPTHHSSTWEHESYKNSHQHRARGRHRDHHRP